MKKLFILFCILLSCHLNAQDFNTLIRRADSLKRKSKPKQALALYEKAIDRVVTYQDKVSNKEWLLVSNNAAELTGKKVVPEYDPERYRVDGERFTERVNELKAAGVVCIFTYNSFDWGVGTSYITDPVKRTPYFPKNEIKVLVWVAGNEVWMQAYGDNIYKPFHVNSPPLADFLKAHYKELPLEKLGRAYPRIFDDTIEHYFRFYWGDTVYEKKIASPWDIANRDKTVNNDKYLTALLPLIQQQVALYYEWLLTK